MPTCSADDVFPWNSGRFLARMFLVDDPLAVPDDYLIFTVTDVQKLNLSFWGVIVAIVPHGTFLHTGRNSCEAAAVAASNTVVARQRIRVVKGRRARLQVEAIRRCGRAREHCQTTHLRSMEPESRGSVIQNYSHDIHHLSEVPEVRSYARHTRLADS